MFCTTLKGSDAPQAPTAAPARPRGGEVRHGRRLRVPGQRRGLQSLCQLLGVEPLLSGVLATGTAITANYFGNRHWTYRDRDKGRQRREAALFALFSCAGLVLENAALAVSHYGLGFTSALADNLAKNVIGSASLGVPLLVLPHLGLQGARAGARPPRSLPADAL